ncbi:MAG: oligosaccharide flippase family protein [Candidatus Micrarchaeia archaeon]
MDTYDVALGKRLISTGAGVFLGNVSGFIIGIITIIAVARLLGPSSYGTYTIAVSYYLLIDAASSYGFGQYLNKHLAGYDKKDKAHLANVASAGIFLSVVFGVATTCISIFIAYFIANAYAKAGISFFSLFIASLVILFAVPFGSITGALIGLNKAKQMAIATIVENSTQLIFSVLFIIFGMGANGAVLGIVIGYFAGLVYAMGKMFGLFGKALIRLPSREFVSSALKFSLPLGVTNIMSSSVMQFSSLLLGIFVAADLIGNYGIATRSTFGMNALYASFYLTLLSGFSIIANKSSDSKYAKKLAFAYDKLLFYSLILSLPILVFIAVLSRPLVFLMVSSHYTYAPKYLSLIAIGAIIMLIGRFASSVLVAKNYTSKVMVYSAASTAAQLVFLLLLVPFYKVIGAIVAIFFVGSIVSSLFFVNGARKLLGLKFDYVLASKAVLANVLLALLLIPANLLHSNSLALAYGALICIAAYPPILGLSGTLKKEHIKEIRKILEGFPVALNRFLDYASLFAR